MEDNDQHQQQSGIVVKRGTDDNRRPPGGCGGVGVGVGEERDRVPTVPGDWNPFAVMLSPI